VGSFSVVMLRNGDLVFNHNSFRDNVDRREEGNVRLNVQSPPMVQDLKGPEHMGKKQKVFLDYTYLKFNIVPNFN